MIVAQQVITKARKLLVDLGEVGWNNDDLLGWLNSGQREILTFKPNANTEYATIQLVPGTLQSTSAIEFIRISKNMGQSGTAPGLSPQLIAQEVLDGLYPGWQSSPANINVKFYVAERKSPKTFLVFPPQPAVPGYVEVFQAQYPDEILLADIGSANIVDDIYETALIDYVVARGLSENTATSDFNRGNNYMQRFIAALGGKSQSESISEDKSS